MNRVAVVFVCALVVPLASVACGGGRSSPRLAGMPVASTSASPLASGGYVLVDPLAVLHEEPSPTAPRSRGLSEVEARDMREADASWALFRFGEEKDGFVRVESVARAPSGYKCGAPIEELERLELSLWVKRETLGAVTTRRVRITYPDGSAASLVPGVLLHANKGGGREVRVDKLAFSVDGLPADAVGTTFLAGNPFHTIEPGSATGGDAQFFSGAVRFAGRKIDADDWPIELTTVYASRPVPGGVVATARSACVQYEVVLQKDQIEAGFGGLGLVGMGAGMGVATYAKKGATVYFASGKRAGSVRKPFFLGTILSGNPTRSCFAVSLGEEREPSTKDGVRNHLPICMDSKDLDHGSLPP